MQQLPSCEQSQITAHTFLGAYADWLFLESQEWGVNFLWESAQPASDCSNIQRVSTAAGTP